MNKDKTHPIAVMGLGLGGAAASPRINENLAALFKCVDAVCAGKPQFEAFDAAIPAGVEKLLVDADITGLIRRLRERQAKGMRILALTGGDPLFFGLGATLSRHFPPGDLLIYPAVSSMQEACARLALPWDNMRFVSLHGRFKSHDSPWLELARASMSGRPVCLLLDANVQISLVASFLLERGRKAYTMHYFRGLRKMRDSDLAHCANLSGDLALAGAETPLEQHFSLRPEEAARFSPDFSMLPSLLILVPDKGQNPPRPYLGMPDEVFECQASSKSGPESGSGQGLITKQPVRAAILAALRLRPDSLLLDLGSGSGAVALEALALLPEGGAYAVERDPARVEQIQKNRERHGAANLEILQGDSRLLIGHPDFKLKADRIFIGGGLSGDEAGMHLLRQAWRILPGGGGRLVVSCVLLGTLERTRHLLTELGAEPEITAIQASRSSALAGDLQLKACNPVFIVAADKPAESA